MNAVSTISGALRTASTAIRELVVDRLLRREVRGDVKVILADLLVKWAWKLNRRQTATSYLRLVAGPHESLRPWPDKAQGIAVAGPNVGFCGSAEALRRAGNEVRELDGGWLRRDDYPALYELLGERFGGNVDARTFRLPDLRARPVCRACGHSTPCPDHPHAGAVAGHA